MGINFAFDFHFTSEAKQDVFFKPRSEECFMYASPSGISEAHRSQTCKRQPRRMRCSSMTVSPDGANWHILCLGLKRETNSSFRVKRTLFWHKEKANYVETDLLESHFMKMTIMAAVLIFI